MPAEGIHISGEAFFQTVHEPVAVEGRNVGATGDGDYAGHFLLNYVGNSYTLQDDNFKGMLPDFREIQKFGKQGAADERRLIASVRELFKNCFFNLFN